MLKKTMSELERLDIEGYQKQHQTGVILILDNLRSAFNVGSIFRTSDAFGVVKIYLCGITCQTNNRELQKTALGAELSIPSEYVEETEKIVKELRDNNYIICALEQTKNSVLMNQFHFDKDKNYALVLGNEVEGVSEDVLRWCHYTVEIPQVGTKHSLNVANASSIFVWEFFRQFNEA